MRKWYAKLSRPTRTGLNLLLTLLAALPLCCAIHTPAFSEMQILRQAEKAHMVGPGRYIGTVTDDLVPNQAVILADDGEGIIFCRYEVGNPFYQGKIHYREKTGNITVLSCPVDVHIISTSFDLPVLVFHNDPRAVRAELTLDLTNNNSDTPIVLHYELSAQRENPDYFQFTISFDGEGRTEEEAATLYLLARVCDDSLGSFIGPVNHEFLATVRLYDSENTLICEETEKILSIPEQAYTKTVTK